ncbi:hypothetical protein ACQPYE_16835 [Actinosynnema sp. CA-299493]
MFLRFLTRVAGVSILVVGLLAGVVVGTASACQCLPGGEPERYARATHVFAGEVIGKVYESQSNLRYTFKVGDEYKGDVPDVVVVGTYGVATACGLVYLQVGDEYLMFTTLRGDSLRTSTCDGNRPASLGPPITESTTSVASAAVSSPCDAAVA